MATGNSAVDRRQFLQQSGLGAATWRHPPWPLLTWPAGPAHGPACAVGFYRHGRPRRQPSAGVCQTAGGQDRGRLRRLCPTCQKAVKYSQNPDTKRYVDYHQLLSDPQVEAVVIATPDHWHEAMVIDALAAGKADVLREGLDHVGRGGQADAGGNQNQGRVFQLGHQGREYRVAADAGS